MTEKRFKAHIFDDGINERYYDGIIDMEKDDDDAVIVNYQFISNLLNAFNDENEQLKNLCKTLIKHIEKKSIAFIIDDEVRELLE